MWFTVTSVGTESVVALGGGHGLAATLRALRAVTQEITAIVTVADDGGSSGRLRRDFGILPPGDLRMALAALCDDREQTWADVVQHRFGGTGDIAGHAMGNLLIAALWEQTGDIVRGLDLLGELLGAHGRVLPCSLTPLDVVADVAHGADVRRVRGQVSVARAGGRVERIWLEPDDPEPCPESLTAIGQADVLVMGPGSWFTSVLTHLLIPAVRQAIVNAPAQRILVLNLLPQAGETDGFTPARHVEVLAAAVPELRVDVVLADASASTDLGALEQAAARLGSQVHVAPMADAGRPGHHDPARLGLALRAAMAGSRPWQ